MSKILNSNDPAMTDILAQQRDAKFKLWLQNKALKDKAFEYLAKLDPTRAVEDDSLFEVAVALCAVDRLLGEDEKPAVKRTNEDGTAKPVSSSAPAKTLKSAWFKWTMEHHTFSSLNLTDKDVSSLSGGTREYLMSECDIVASSGASREEIDKASKVKNILPSLKYFFPAVPKPNEKPRPLTNDQKVQNTIFLREAKLLYRKASNELKDRLTESVAKALKKMNGTKDNVESERKSKADFNTSRSDLSDADNNAGLIRRLEGQVLNDLSLKQLRLWIEEDEDEKNVKNNTEQLERVKQAKTSHEQFVKKKDSLRIRMPDDITAPVAPTMGYGKELAGVRPAVKGPQTTVDLMAGMGLKYVHATNKGRKGVEGDLERSRNQLLKLGFVNKENFDEEDSALYAREKRENQVIVEKAALDAKLKEDNSKAFDDWLVQKEMRDQALHCLRLLPKPTSGGNENEETNVRSSRASMGSTSMLSANNKAVVRDSEEARHCIEVGKALKKVDRTLFKEWAVWCEGVFRVNVANVLWDFFPPMACDVHSAAYSQVRDSFIKLLRPGVDFRQTFMDFVESNIFARRINRLKNEKEYYRLRDDAREEMDEEIESLRKQWLEEVSVSKSNMTLLLRQLGITLKDTEMRALIDAFDSNGDGVVTLKEFLDFTGPKRDKRSGNSLVMAQRCCWMTTCKVTGMANGYSVSAATKRYLKMEEAKGATSEQSAKKRFDDYEEEYSKEADEDAAGFNANLTGNVVIRKLANGDSRMCVELKERGKREEILKRLHLIKDNKDNKDSSRVSEERSKKQRDADEEEDNYGDEFEQEGDEDGGAGGDNKSKSGTQKGVAIIGACDFSTWRTEDRRKGLKYLFEVSKEQREEETVKNLLASGKPPGAPKFYIDHETALETRSKIRRDSVRASDDYNEDDEGPGDSSTSLTLHWEPVKGDHISFYSVEFAGSVGLNTKLGDTKYVEIFRDPVDADPDNSFTFSHVMADLLPGTSYRFRIRAFNGHGPSDYTYKTFTTRTEAPLKPRVIRVAFDSVTLRWTFSEGFFRRIEELKKIFQLADSDKSGAVSREELTAVLDVEASGSPKLKTFLNKVANSMGLDLAQGYGALFDKIEADDDNGLSWPEFEGFFMAAGWGNTASVAAPLNASHMSMARGSMTGTVSGSASVAVKPGAINYVIQRCESEFDDKYVEVTRTNLGQVSVSRLEPGKSYRFRVYSVNADGVAGPFSESVLVHTLLETPAPPSVNVKNVSARKVTLTWRARNYMNSTRDKASVDRMLGDWAGLHGENDGGVSIEAAFAKYDINRSGDIDASELACILEDLGVEVTEERLSEAFSLLDVNKDGVISYEEFGIWWRRDEVTYTLKRSEEVLPRKGPANINISNNNTAGNDYKPSKSAIEDAILSASRNAPSTALPPRAVSRGRGENSRTLLSTIAEGTLNSSIGRTRPSSAGGTMKPPTPPVMPESKGGLSGQNTTKQVGLPIVSYRGSKTRCDIAGLTPNRLYHFKLRYCGSRSNSELSEPLVLMTAPLAPTAPVIIELTSSTVRAKWYAPEYGAFKFIVHLKQVIVSGLDKSVTLNKNRKNATTSIVGQDAGDGWVSVYNGQENNFVTTVLASDTTYLVRIIAVNCQGVCSEPSPIVNFTTLARNDTSEQLTVRNAGSTFTVECTGDICVGDTILITERLYAKTGSNNHNSSRAERQSMNDSVTGSVHASAIIKMTAKVNPTTSKTAVHMTNPNKHLGASGTLPVNPMSMSVTSLNAGGVTISASPGAFIGERTIAAYVAKDNYRTIRNVLSELNISPTNNKRVGQYRKLWLEVVWQKASNEACKPYEVRPGEVLERLQGHLEQFEVFRVKWKQEETRRQFHDEYVSLVDCYLQTDC